VEPSIDASSWLVVFASDRIAREALRPFNSSSSSATSVDECGFKLRSLNLSSASMRSFAVTLPAPPVPRPSKDARVATRLVAGALGIRLPRQTPEQREEERIKREERKMRMQQEKKEREAEAAATEAAAPLVGDADADADSVAQQLAAVTLTELPTKPNPAKAVAVHADAWD